MKKAKMRRSLALLLALVMCFGLLPMGALAAQADERGPALEGESVDGEEPGSGTEPENESVDGEEPGSGTGPENEPVDSEEPGSGTRPEGEPVDGEEPGSGTTCTVSGTVTDGETVLEGVTVSAGDCTATTDAQGVYTLELPSAEGSYTLFFTKDEYEDGTLEVTVSDANVSGQDIQLRQLEAPQAEEVQETDELPDAALVDNWVQIAGSKVSGAVAPYIDDDGRIVLSSAAGNGNNLDNQNPAIFVNTDMNKVLSKLEGTAEKTLSFTLTPSSSGTWMGFALLLKYDGTTGSSVKAYHIGYPSGDYTGWFAQNYGASNVGWPGFTGPDMVANQPVDFEITWTDSRVSSFKIDGNAITLPATSTIDTVPGLTGDNADGLQGVGFKVGSKGDTTTLRLSNVHYTGQDPNKQPVPTYPVSGTVSDGSNPIEGATVTLKGTGESAVTKTAKTDAQGAYKFARVEAGEYTMSASAKNYDNSKEETVSVTESAVTQDFTLNRKSSQIVPDDGVSTDVWKRDPQTDAGKTGNSDSICALENGQIHVKSGPKDGNGSSPTAPGSWPGVFYNETANAALAAAAAKGENRWMEMTFVRADGSTPRFGFYFNYNNPCDGFFIGCNNESGWFWQDYCPGGKWGSNVGSTPTVGKEVTVRAVWNDKKVVSFEVNGDVLFENVAISGTGTGVGLRMTSWSPARAEWYIKEMHYSGQKEVTVYNVAGTVKDDKDEALAGVTVTAGRYTATTAQDGTYNLMLPAGDYTFIASKDGYENGTKEVAVVDGALTGQDLNLRLLPVVSGTVKDQGTSNPIPDATVRLSKGTGSDAVVKTAVTNERGEYRLIGVPEGEYTVSVTAVGYKLADDAVKTLTVEADATADFTLVEDLDSMYILENDGMKVLVDKAFPRVVQYRLKGSNGQLNGLQMDGQKKEISTIKINGTAATLGTITSVCSEDGKTVTYTIPMTAPVGATMTARLTLDNEVNKADSASKDRTLGFYIDKVEYAEGYSRLTTPVKNIEIPDHCLVSVNSAQTGAKATCASASGNTSVKTNDVTYLAEDEKSGQDKASAYFAAFVSNDKLSAGITSNSSLNGGLAATSNAVNRVSFVHDGGNVTFGLSSVAWPYDYLLADSNPRDGDHTADLTAEQKVVSEELREQPFVKVVIAPELNSDGKVDWQDGAIALRETVMHIPNNSQSVKDRVNTRIALNFGSQAQNPFLTSLDNAKRVALHTDGLGQAILLKGYAGEGHDSNHPDYWDMGTRMGGPTDFKTMLEEGKKIGAYYGIHVNAGELYAEAEALNDKIIFYRTDGRVKWGWHWHDTAISFKTLYDFGSGDRQSRFQRLLDEGGEDLEFIYVDIWGNATGGTDDSWQTRMLTNEITRQVHGTGTDTGKWRIAHEWSWANPYDSTFQHWTTDFTYGNFSEKGALNSAVIRFLLNEYKDSFPPDFASYGGACNAPLLGGPAMQGFEGWQGDGEYDLSIYNTYNQMIPTKFLQHYGITQWINADNAVTIPYNSGGAGGPRGTTTAKWTPEMQITLEGDGNKIVVTRGTDSTLDTEASFSLATEETYRSRVITFNNKVILRGAPASAGEDNTFPHSKATLQYLIPWYWKANGTPLEAENEKLYHWNAKGGTSTWDLPRGWEDLQTVVYYELSDQGRGEAQTLTVTGGSITFPDTIKAETGYVVVKGETVAAAPNVTYTAKGQHITDPSFNDASFTGWEKTGTVEKVNSIHGISVMKQTGTASVSQTLTEMEAGKKYLAYVAVENKSDNQAYIEIKDAEGNVLARNYTLRSIATNYISGDSLNNRHGVESGGSMMQNMYVFFVMPDSGDVTLTLGHEGDGYVYFDALRILETQMDGYTYAEDGSVNGLKQDFENSAQGEWPFVVAGVEGVTDNRQHLSEKHAPYTQSGWNIREVDDVINGDWSLKTHGINGNGKLVYQTIPQNFRFEPGKTYLVTFKYEMGCENLMQVVVGDGQWSSVNSCRRIPLEMAKGAGFKGYPAGTDVDIVDGERVETPHDAIPAGSGPKTCAFVVTGSESGQTWIGIATAGGSFDNTGIPDRDGYGLFFSGRGDFILDDLSITETNVDCSALLILYESVKGTEKGSYTDASWDGFQTALSEAKAVLDKDNATQDEIDSAKQKLQDAFDGLTSTTGAVTGIKVFKDGTVVNENTPLKVYTNKDHAQHSLTLTAQVEPADAANKNVNWIRETVEGKVALSRNGNELTITAIHDEAETNVGVVTLNIVAEADPNVKQTIKVQVIRMLANPVTISIHGVDDPDAAPKFGQTLEADINQLKMTDAGKAALSYQWKRNGSAISGATAKTYTLTAADIGATISVDVAADPNTYYEGTRSATRSQAVVKAEGPAITADIYGVKGADNSNGKIVGFPTSDGNTYEYKLTDAADTAESWTTVSTDEVTVAAGSYVVRIKATTTHEAGPTRNVTVPAYDSDMHRVILGTFQNGTITRDHPQADPDTTITLTVKPATGYELDTITVAGASGSVTVSGTGNTRTFKMPDEDVTVSATFKKIKLTIDHSGLVNLRCSKDVEGVLDDHEVEYGDIAAITLVPDAGYGLPAGEAIEITNANGDKITGWTISRDGTITITGGVTSNLTIKAAGVVKTYVVNYTLTNGLSAPEANAPRQVAHKAAYTGKLVAASGYMLPESISITMGGEEFTDFTYENGTLTIPEGKITGNLVITATGAVNIYTVNYTLTNGLSAPEANAARQVAHGTAYTGTLVAASGYMLPERITITMNGEEFTDFTYENGTLAIAEGKITGNLVITASGTADGGSGDSGNSSGGTTTPPTSTEVKENPDGSTTTTVTDKKTGTVTETTEKPDGTKEIVETKKDGTVTETTEKPDGSKEIVETKPDGTVTETKTDTEGGEVAKVTDPDQNVEIKVTDPSGEVLAEVKLPAEIPVPENRFVDVPENHWADEAVHEMAGLGLVSGVGNNKFDMSSNMKRGDLALILSRLSNAKTDYELTFTDVPAGKYYANGVAWAAKSGVVTGRSAEKFDPEATITRGELAVMLYRYAMLLKLDTSASAGALEDFKDGSDTPDWAMDGLAWCVENGILKGKGGGILDSTATTTRAEVAVMLQRFVNLMK